MTSTDTIESRILILAPIGRDAPAIGEVLKRVGLDSLPCGHVAALVAALHEGAGAVLVAEEALVGRQVQDLASWVERQPPWSDMPFIVLACRDMPAERILRMVSERAPDGFEAIEDVLTAEELVRMTGAYRRTSFVDAEALNGRPSYTVVG